MSAWKFVLHLFLLLTTLLLFTLDFTGSETTWPTTCEATIFSSESNILTVYPLNWCWAPTV